MLLCAVCKDKPATVKCRACHGVMYCEQCAVEHLKKFGINILDPRERRNMFEPIEQPAA